jgi:hypothetical protein
MSVIMKTEAPRKRMKRIEAAAYLQRLLDLPVSPKTIRAWPIPYRHFGRDAVYEVIDLDRFAEKRLTAPARYPKSYEPA